MEFTGKEGIETALQLVGELLQARALRFRIVIIGGAAANLLGYVERATNDVDILAFGDRAGSGPIQLRPPDEPIPEPLEQAAQTVARDLNLDPYWLNTGPAGFWKTGLPPGLAARLRWRVYGGLEVGLVDRHDLIFFKLYAAMDHRGPDSVHFQDLLALAPTDQELEAAGQWVREQDPTPIVAEQTLKVILYVRSRRA